MLLWGNTTNDWMKSLYFYPHNTENRENCFTRKTMSITQQAFAQWNACIYSMRASVCCAKWTVSMSRVYIAWQNFVQLCWFSGWSAGKNNPDFVQPLAVFRYSNIYYLGAMSPKLQCLLGLQVWICWLLLESGMAKWQVAIWYESTIGKKEKKAMI